MKPQFVFFSMVLGISEISLIATAVPALPLLLSLILLATAGKRYFAYFWLVQVGISLSYYYLIDSFELNDIMPLLNYGVYSTPSNSPVPTPTMLHHSHPLVAVLYGVIGFGIIGGIFGGGYLFYRRVKHVLKGRVERWNP